MSLEERVRQLEEKIKELRPGLSFPSTATLEQRVRWLEIVVRELVDGNRPELLKRLLGNTIYIKPDRITLHSLTADPASCAEGDIWYRSDLDKLKLAVDATPANAKELSTFTIEDHDKVERHPLSVLDPMARSKWGYYHSETLRNSNDPERTTSSSSYVKLKEVKLGGAITAFRLKLDVRMSSGINGYVSIRHNDSGIASITHTVGTTVRTYSRDLEGNFQTDDLIQIYGRSGLSGAILYVSNMRFYYDRGVTEIADKELSSPLITTGDPTVPMTNQDP